jgi:cytochrome c553
MRLGLKVFPAAALLAAALSPLPSAAAPDAARGRAVAEARQCLTCHGAQGLSSTPEVPSLAGMPDQVVVLQLIIMREKLRNVAVMGPFVEGLGDAEAEDLGAFFASLPPAPAEDRGPADPARMATGSALAQRLRCGICHLPDFRGREQMPRLAGQREDYLLHALRQYRDNQRIGTDTQMTGILYGLTDADLAALAHFMAQQ